MLTKSKWLALFGSLKWDNGGYFQLVFEPNDDGDDATGVVWLQTEDAENDATGTSCRLRNVTSELEAQRLRSLLVCYTPSQSGNQK